MKNFLVFITITLLVFIAFSPFVFQNRLPIPSDTIIGLYHPFRDFYAKEYPNGIPFKNFLITDPVRQQYIWRSLAIQSIKDISLPLWNPYNFSGTPLLANFQTAAFYPLNILLFILPFSYGWSVLVLLQPLLAGIFLYLYLRYMKLTYISSLFAGIVFSFSGFSIAWMEWNTIVHVALWLPLILLAIEHLLRKRSFWWIAIFVFAQCSQIFAGHLQVWFYSLVISNIYLLARIWQLSQKGNYLKINSISIFKKYFPFLLVGIVVFFITAIQLVPTLQFITQSARDIDQGNWQKEGWFLPWQHLIQFLAPDFFGNPATLNYWGIWNYAEFLGYIGIVPLVLAIFALCFRRDKKTFLWGTLFFLSLIFALPNTIVSSLPFILKIPFIASAQPTRLIFVTDFCLAILAGLGLDFLYKKDVLFNKKIIYIISSFFLFFVILWIFVIKGSTFTKVVSEQNLFIAKRNLYLPTLIFFVCTALLLIGVFVKKKYLQSFLVICLLLLTCFDLLRTFNKFTPFSSPSYLYPHTPALAFLNKNIDHYRLISVDNRILPPNFSGEYNLQSVDGYDPLYLLSYAELISANERNQPNIKPPFGFNRIITPLRFDTQLIDLLGVKYILSLADISSPKLTKVFQEGQTRIYENEDVLPRVYFVDRVTQLQAENKEGILEYMFKNDRDFKSEAVIENDSQKIPDHISSGKAEIISYHPNKIIIKTNNTKDGFLVLTDIFYPSWEARVRRVGQTDYQSLHIFRTNYTFRGVFLPKGVNEVEFYNKVI